MEYIGYKIGVMKGDKFDYLIYSSNEYRTLYSTQQPGFPVSGFARSMAYIKYTHIYIYKNWGPLIFWKPDYKTPPEKIE